MRVKEKKCIREEDVEKSNNFTLWVGKREYLQDVTCVELIILVAGGDV